MPEHITHVVSRDFLGMLRQRSAQFLDPEAPSNVLAVRSIDGTTAIPFEIVGEREGNIALRLMKEKPQLILSGEGMVALADRLVSGRGPYNSPPEYLVPIELIQ